PAHFPGPGDGRPVVAGERRRLPRSAAGGDPPGPVLPDADHRGGHREARTCAGPRGRCRRPAGAGHVQEARRPADRLRRAARGRRPVEVGRGEVAGPGDRGGGEGGYARELTEEERAEQQRRLTEAITGFDVVITTAQVPGRKAPTLVTAEAVQGMKAGS